MSEASESLLRHILEAPYPEMSDHSSFSPVQLLETASSVDKENFDKLKTAYDSCQDEATIKKEGLKPIIAVLKELGALLPNKQTDTKALGDSLAFLNKLGVSALVSLGPGADDKDPDTVVTQVTPPWRIGLPAKDYYENDKVVKRYTDTIEQVCEGFESSYDVSFKPKKGKKESCKQIALELVAFEKKLASASPDPEDLSDVTVSWPPNMIHTYTNKPSTTTIRCP